MQPVPQMMGLTPGQRPITAREHTPSVTHGQSGPLGGLDNPGGPTHLQRLGRRPTENRGQQGHGGPQPGRQGMVPAGLPDPLVGSGGIRVAQVLGGRRQGPRNRARAVRTLPLAAPAPMYSRVRSQLAVEAACTPRFSAGGAASVHGGQGVEPAAFQAIEQPPELEHLVGQGGVRQPIQVLGGQLVHGGDQHRQPIRRAGSRPGRVPVHCSWKAR
jgi:hypothetical protein